MDFYFPFAHNKCYGSSASTHGLMEVKFDCRPNELSRLRDTLLSDAERASGCIHSNPINKSSDKKKSHGGNERGNGKSRSQRISYQQRRVSNEMHYKRAQLSILHHVILYYI